MRVLIVGCGYVGTQLGAELGRQGCGVFGVRRTASAEVELRAVGIKPILADISNATEVSRIPGDFDWVVNCVASGGGSADEYERVYLQGMQNLIRRFASNPPKKLVYTSSTSVYAQDGGELVDESSLTIPESPRAKILLRTEQVLMEEGRKSFSPVILRLAGIYGPGRGYWLKQYLQNTATMEPDGKRILNMVHRDDVVGSIVAALERGRSGQVYNVVDDEPVTQKVMFDWLSGRLRRPLPPVVNTADGRQKRGASNKRVINRKLKSELGYVFKYPTFREGYAAELARLEFGSPVQGNSEA